LLIDEEQDDGNGHRRPDGDEATPTPPGAFRGPDITGAGAVRAATVINKPDLHPCLRSCLVDVASS
jgi:hypothetical protein